MADVIKLLAITLYVYSIGYCVINALLVKLTKKISLYSFIGLSGIIGLGSIGTELFLFYLVRIPWQPMILALPWVAIFIWLILKKEVKPKIIKPTALNYYVLIFFLIVALLLTGWAITYPATAFDAWSIWNFKAQIFYLCRTIPLGFLTDLKLNMLRPNYPILLPLDQTWIYLHLGKIQTGYSQVIYPIFFAGMLLVSLDFFKSVSKNTLLPFILTLLLALTPCLIENSLTNYADIIVATYTMTGLAAMIRYLRGDGRLYLYLSTITFGFGAFTKNEGAVIYGLFVVFLGLNMKFVQKKRLKTIIKETFAPIAFSSIAWVGWVVFDHLYHLKTVLPMTRVTLKFTREYYRYNLETIFTAIVRRVLLAYSFFGGVWLLYLTIFVVTVIKRIESARYFIFLFLIIVAYIALYFYTPLNLERQLMTSLMRLASQITPSAILLLGFTLLIIWDKDRKTS